jgi:hypothetical protein
VNWAIPAQTLEMATAELRRRMVAAWVEANWPTTTTDPSVCHHCGKRSDNLIPMGVGPHIWVHWECFDLHRAARRRQGVIALGFDALDDDK